VSKTDNLIREKNPQKSSIGKKSANRGKTPTFGAFVPNRPKLGLESMNMPFPLVTTVNWLTKIYGNNY